MRDGKQDVLDVEAVLGLGREVLDFARDGDGRGGEGLGERDGPAHRWAIEDNNGLR